VSDTNEVQVYGGSAWATIADADVMVVDSANSRVGIGTATPGAELDIQGASSPEIRFQSTDSTDPYFYFGDQVDAVRGGIGMDISENTLMFRGYNNNTRMAIDASGNVGIGTASPDATLEVIGDVLIPTGSGFQFDRSGTASDVLFKETPSSTTYGAVGDAVTLRNPNSSNVEIHTAGTRRMTINSTGNVGIGTATPGTPLNIVSGSSESLRLQNTTSTTQGPYIGLHHSTGRIGFIGFPNNDDLHIKNESSAGEIYLSTNNTTRMTVTDTGNVGIGITSPTSTLHINGELNQYGDFAYLGSYNASGNYPTVGNQLAIGWNHTGGARDMGFFNTDTASAHSFRFYQLTGAASKTQLMTISAAGNVGILGSLSKGSGSFDIAHPIKGGDWRLRHSFIEGPQADLIYRGTVTLVNGSATVDLDEKAGMTDGTWEALCRDPWSMASSSGNTVEWVLDGKTLTITSATLDAVCPWIVMAERQDDHMASEDCPLTGPADDPAIIVEYERPPEVDEPVETPEPVQEIPEPVETLETP
jgi:hypothetical protein